MSDSSHTADDTAALYTQHVAHNYSTPAISLVRGEELKTLIDELSATPPAVLKRVDELTRN